jgi:cytochrome c oxidase assembly factor CtaG
VLVVTLALLMWMPVVGPIPEWQMGPAGKCVYLFLMSVVPTVPAGWLTFAEGVVYKHYSQPIRVWGISVTDDQQLAGAIMKIGGAAFLWSITTTHTCAAIACRRPRSWATTTIRSRSIRSPLRSTAATHR